MWHLSLPTVKIFPWFTLWYIIKRHFGIYLNTFKVENYLMLSEYEQNLIKETEGPNADGHRKWTSRKWSMFKSAAMPTINSESEDVSGTTSGIETQKSVSEISEHFLTNFSRTSFKNKLRFSNRASTEGQIQTANWLKTRMLNSHKWPVRERTGEVR